MGSGAYDVVKNLRTQGNNIDMCYVSREGLVWVFRETNNIEPVRIGLKDYFASDGWNVTSKPEPDEKFQSWVELLFQNARRSHSLLCDVAS